MREFIEQQLESVTGSDEGAAGIGVAIGIALALWSASSGMKHLIDALNAAYDEDEGRGFVKVRALSLALTIGAVLFVARRRRRHHRRAAVVEGPLALLRWPLLGAAFVAALAVLYRYAPSRDEPEWRWTTPGALVATVLWLVASGLFSIYVGSFGSYNETYGSLGGVVVVMLWLFLTAAVVLFGAELDAELERQTTYDTTEGRDRPMGDRDAYAADTVGPTAEEVKIEKQRTKAQRQPLTASRVRRRARSASRPGRSPCSRSSREAPPPVDTWSMRSARPNWATAAALSPPPTTVRPLRRGDRLGDGTGAGLEARVLERAHRAVPEHRAGVGDDVAELRGRAGPDVDALPAVGQVGAGLAHLAALVGLEQHAVGRQRGHVGRQVDPVAGSASSRRHVSTWSASTSESPTRWPWATRNVKHMPPPMTRASTTPSSASMTASLSDTLAPPSTATNGRSGFSRMPSEHLDLALEQPAGGRRQRLPAARRSTRGRGATRRRRRSRRRRSRRSASTTNAGSLPSSPGSKRRFSSSSTPGASSASRARTGSTEYFGFGCPFGRPRWVQATTVAPVLLQPPQRRHRGADAEVVGDAAVLERDVEVAADEDPLAVDRRAGPPGSGPRTSDDAGYLAAASLAPVISMRSTSRFE